MYDDWKYSKESPLPPPRRRRQGDIQIEPPEVFDTVLPFSDWEAFDPSRVKHYIELADKLLESDPKPE